MTTWDTGRWLALQRAAGRPETTIKLRAYHVERAARDLRRPAELVTVDDLAEWLAGQAWAPETRRSYRATLRAYFAWCVAAGLRLDNPAAALPAVTTPRGVPRPAPEQVLRDALDRAQPRERLMIELAAVCGLRRGELARASRRDVVPDLVGWSLIVHGKGGHTRRLPLPEDLGNRLARMPDGPLFRSSLDGSALTPEHVGKLVSRALPPGWTCHNLRHRCATIAYRATTDLRAVQELLGHAKPETTARYTLVPDDALRRCVLAAAG